MEPIFGQGLNPNVKIASEHLPFVLTVQGCDWAVAQVETGVSADYDLYIAPLKSVRDASTDWKPVAKMSDKVGTLYGSYFAVHGDSLLLISRKNAPNGKIIRLNIHDLDKTPAEVIYEPERGVIQSMDWAKDALYIKVLEGGPSTIIRLSFDALDDPERVEMPGAGRVSPGVIVPQRSGAYLTHGSWNQPTQHYHYNPLTRELVNTGLIPSERPAVCHELKVTVVHYPSHDGVKIPMSIVHKADLRMDGENPTCLVGYGAYGITIQPKLWKSALPFLEKGGILSIAHVRGGGAYGESWHQAGYKATKPNTWKDVIAAAEYLIDNKYTSTQHLVVSGRSAGGITAGRAITERPDLFGGALIGVGVSDAVRMETTPNGVPNIPEFGTVKKEDEFHSLLAMSSYHHVQDGVHYPAVLITHGANDTRVELWQSLKMAARLQAATASTAPVLLRVDYGSGHGRSAMAELGKALDADTYSFILNLDSLGK